MADSLSNISSWFILPVTLLLAPFILKVAVKQDKKIKSVLRSVVWITILSLQLLLGFFNWERFNEIERSGFELSLTYYNSFLWLFFLLTIIQIILLLTKRRVFDITSLILNAINVFVFFFSVITISRIVGYQIVSLWSIVAIFLVLIGNVVGLMLVNKDSKLLSNYPWSSKGVKGAQAQTLIQKFMTWIVFGIIAAFIFLMLILNFKQQPQTITSQDAILKVKELPEVKTFLMSVQNGHVEVEQNEEDPNNYLIHVYEIVNDHTATFNWYLVNKSTGEIEKQF